MRFWGKKTEKQMPSRGVARAAAAGASREELLREVLKDLIENGNADRLGVWVAADPEPSPPGEAPGILQGLVWDREIVETPKEWSRLSVEALLLEDVLSAGKSVEQDMGDVPERPIIGPLVGLRRVLWIPVARSGQLKGVLLAGGRGKQIAISREHAESVAAELALAVQLEEENRIARLRNADLSFARQHLGAQGGEISTETLLLNLVDSCTRTAKGEDGPGAVFAVIGALAEERTKSGGRKEIEFRWSSGEPAWTHAVNSEPLASVWQQALEARSINGSEPPGTWARGSVARIVAFPLESEGRLVGAMVAGIPVGAASLAMLERLEFRASLAAAALERRERKRGESRRADWQQALLDSSSEAIFILDEAARIAASSRAARDLTGEAPKGDPAHPASPGRTGPSLWACDHFAELFQGRDRAQVETWLRKTLGGEFAAHPAQENSLLAELHNGVSVRVRMAPVAPGGGATVVLEPLADRASARQEDHAEIELRSVLEWLEEGVVLFDTGENVRFMNTRFEQIVGLAAEESGTIKTLDQLIARLAGQAAEPEPFAERWRELARGINGGVREELQMVRPAPRILERAARPLLDAIGRPLGHVEIYRDLTAQRVFQSKLLQTEKLAALGQMVSGIAHELSNPLTSILGYAQRLLVRQDVSGRKDEARHIYQEAERAGTILRQLLLNARETLPERRLVSLNQIALRAMELQRFSLAAEKIRVEIDLDPVLPFVFGDSGRLQQVLMNLMGNARQALEQRGSGGTIRVRSKRFGERRVLLEVEDDGPGIPAAILARIFDPFFTTKPAGIGTGLGLAIVLSIVREHGGQVHVQSPPQGGALFQIELPSAAEVPKEKAAAGSSSQEEKSLYSQTTLDAGPGNPSAVAPEPSGTGKGGRVLVVEDEPTVARLIADVLEDEGFQVDVLMDGRGAVDHAARQLYDLVVCDMKMPGLDGQHFYKALVRARSPLRERFLFVTGDIVSAHTHEFLLQNKLPHVAKPFRVEELTEKVHRVLEGKFHGEPPPAVVARKNVARNG
jgi:signal transduction histidine kinase/CheY-like chemotaxis protein